MKRKRNESTVVSNKVLCLQNGSHVEVQLDDGKWHAGIVVQCQPRKYLVQVEQQQCWIESDLIRPNTILDQKRNVSFEYRPGQFLRNETKSNAKIVSDEKVCPAPLDPSAADPAIDLKKRRLPRTTSATTEQKKSPFVWKPSTISSIQTRRSSRSNPPTAVSPENNRCRTRASSNATQPKTASNSNAGSITLGVKTSPEAPSSEVLIFRPNTNGKSADHTTSPTRHCSTDDENFLKPDENRSTRHRHSKDEEYPDLAYHISASTDSRSSSTTSTDNPYLANAFETIPTVADPQIKSEPKSSCFLETPPPSLPDIHVVQESDPSLDKPLQQLKSKRKQDRPQRKQMPFKSQDQGHQLNGVLDRLLSKQKDDREDSAKASSDLCDPGYLSDEYGEPAPSNKDSLPYSDLENLCERLEQLVSEPADATLLNDEDKALCERLRTYVQQNAEKLEKARLESFPNTSNARSNFTSKVLQRIFSIAAARDLGNLFHYLPEEIKTSIKLCLNHALDDNSTKKRMVTRGKRLINFGQKPPRTIKNKRASISHPPALPPPPPTTTTNATSQETSLVAEQQMLLSPASPLTPLSAKAVEQPANEDLLSPTNHQLINSGVMEEIPVLPKERDVYEVIHCLCNCEIDNGFMIQCETCLCWSHCECVGVTATCIPAFFKCSICTKAEAERAPQWSPASIFDDETTASFLTTANNAERVSLFLSLSRRLWNLSEQMIELKLRSTPTLRSLQRVLRCDDLREIFQCANIKSEEMDLKIAERRTTRENLECVSQTIDDLVDSVCSSSTPSSCLYIDLPTKTKPQRKPLTDQMDVLITHLSDDEDTRQARRTIQIRYERLMSTVDNKIQTILREHQSIQTQMAFELGILQHYSSDDCLSYDAHELALRTAIERLQC